MFHGAEEEFLLNEIEEEEATRTWWVAPNRAARFLESVDRESKSNYGPLVAYAFTLNYILGVGSLGVPLAFYKSGLLVACFLVIFVSFVSYMTVMWVAEVVHRAEKVGVLIRSRNAILVQLTPAVLFFLGWLFLYGLVGNPSVRGS